MVVSFCKSRRNHGACRVRGGAGVAQERTVRDAPSLDPGRRELSETFLQWGPLRKL